ncbi:MAG: hypothetical protein M0030_14090 [Actinomycetota bacterium]|nr:hypothetical protein [Actinomycetota bacterium]
MFTVAVTVTVALGAAVAAVAAARYRLSVEFVPAVIIFAVFAGTVPAWADGAFGRAWPAAVCLVSAVVMLLAAGWAVRSRSAQLLPGWGRVLEREVEAEAAAEDAD